MPAPALSEYTISTDRSRLDLELIHRRLSTDAYWALGRERAVNDRAWENSMPFGAYLDGELAAWARVVTDRATFAWLADVFVLPEHRGRGVGKLLVSTILEHPELSPMKRWLLATADAHELYRRYGFDEVRDNGRMMAIEPAADTEVGSR
jgi:GNAT superfamily N-acetyltransferase